MKRYIFITKKYLAQEYSRKRKSERQIANQIGCSRSFIAKRLEGYDIYIRSISESRKIKYSFITKDFIEKEYATKSICKIAEELGCSSKVINNKMKEFNIPIRTCIERNGKNAYNYNPERDKKHYCIESNCHNEICYWNWEYSNGRCQSCANSISSKKRWKNKKYREKNIKAILKASKITPNGSEKQLNELLNIVLPNEYKINVKGEAMILGGKIPDFVNVNGQKKVIELFGDYWHSSPKRKKADKNRIKLFKKLGYETLIIWGHELKDLDRVREKLEVFNAV